MITKWRIGYSLITDEGVVNVSIDPYKAGLFNKDPYHAKRDCVGEMVVVLDGMIEDRGLQLMVPKSRAVCRHEIHELILTDESGGPGSSIQHIAYLGFFEVLQGSVILAGDELLLENRVIATISGFDETHMPNHLNIVAKVTERKAGPDLGAYVGQRVVIRHTKGQQA